MMEKGNNREVDREIYNKEAGDKSKRRDRRRVTRERERGKEGEVQ